MFLTAIRMCLVDVLMEKPQDPQMRPTGYRKIF